MTRPRDPRDRLLEAAMAVDEVERHIREATRAIRQSPCSQPEACWGDGRWREPDADLGHYCAPCRAGTAQARRRHELRQDRQRRLDALRRACATFRRSIWGAAWLASRQESAPDAKDCGSA